jgi:hypothetical protein
VVGEIRQFSKPSRVVHARNPSNREAEAARSKIQGQQGLAIYNKTLSEETKNKQKRQQRSGLLHKGTNPSYQLPIPPSSCLGVSI